MMQTKLIIPYCGELKPLIVSDAEQHRIISEEVVGSISAEIKLSSREAGDLEMMAIGAFSPLQGFMNQDDWHGVCDAMKMANGTFWPIPICLSCSKEQASKLKVSQSVKLISPDDKLVAIMEIEDIYEPDKKFEAKQVFQTDDDKHPGVRSIYAHGEVYLGGSVKVLSHSPLREKYKGVYLTPSEVRGIFEEKGWHKIAAFQTRNPLHRAHEYLVKTALEVCDGVLVHSLLGNLKAGDIPAQVRVQAIDVLIENYFKSGSVINAGYPLDMRYAGPREALLHALFRQNYACSHLIIGRDHAGVGDYYDDYAAQRIFGEIDKDALQIEPMMFEHSFWCNKCNGMASNKTCPHDIEDKLILSGTKLRDLLSKGEEVPANFSRHEVLEILSHYYQKIGKS